MDVRSLRVWIALGLPLLAASAGGEEPKPKAGTYAYTATVVGAARAQGAVTASGIRWQCAGSRCTTSGPWPVPGVSACAALAKQVGAISSYGHPGRQLDKAGLDKCNGGALIAKTAAAPAPTAAASKPAPSTSGTAASGMSLPSAANARASGALAPAGMALRKEHYASLQRARAEAEAAAQRQREEEAERRRRANTKYGEDCDDRYADVHPGAAEICDRRDNNCDGLVDEGQTLARYLDADGDGHGDASRRMDVCPGDITAAASSAERGTSGWLVEIGNDCDDADPDRWRDCR